MNEYTFYAKVTFYNDEMEENDATEYIVITANSYSNATAKIEKYYGINIVSFEIFSKEEIFHKMTEKEYEEIKSKTI